MNISQQNDYTEVSAFLRAGQVSVTITISVLTKFSNCKPVGNGLQSKSFSAANHTA